MSAPADSVLLAELDRAIGPRPPRRLGIAVSGGSDSLGLLHLAADWARGREVALAAVTVDHGLRPEARGEAAMAGLAAQSLGVGHDLLVWTGWEGRGNLMDAARRARMALIADWARGQGLDAVALGHTADDQAETLLMRLARGSGVDGLSGMAPQRQAAGILWLRPLLGLRRADLRAFLARRGVTWVEDPSNQDPRFERVRMRRALASLGELGIDAAGLAETAARLREARAALAGMAAEAAERVSRVEVGDVVIARGGLAALPAELQRRLFAHALTWVSGADYAPRHAQLAAALEAALAGRPAVLHGCRILAEGEALRVCREWAAVRGLVAAPGALWDRRWRLLPATGVLAAPAGAEVRALGQEGLSLCPKWRDTGVPRAALLASPALWLGDRLIAAPLAGRAEGWQAELACGKADYVASVLAH